jgi:uncharacterized membrane protein YfcA
MIDLKYVIIFCVILALPIIATIYTVASIYDIQFQTIIYYFVAFCFVISIISRLKGKQKRHQAILRTNIDKNQDAYSDFVYN